MGKMKDIVMDIMAYESGEMNEQEILDFFQYLVDTKLVWQLQGHYGRTATALIETGAISDNTNTHSNTQDND
jgi:hypothetical protein